MKSELELKPILDFIAEYASCLFGCGVHTSRVMRNTKRIGKSQNVDVQLSVLTQSLYITVKDEDSDNFLTRVVNVNSQPISFRRNSDLSELSWDAVDEHLDIETLRKRYNEIVSQPRLDPRLVTLIVGFANGSFCKLFGGDWISIFAVFVATVIGFTVRNWLMGRKVNHLVVFSLASFVASIISSVTLLIPNCTSEVALATSPLYLIPGVPLINGMLDIFEGHILLGFGRLMNAFILIFCIAIGLSSTLLIVNGHLL